MNGKHRFVLLASLLALLMTSATVVADPRQWDTTGVVVRKGDDLQWEKVTARNEQGEVLVVWSSFASGDEDIYAQLISPQGEQLWPEGGVVVCGGPGHQAHPSAAAVEDGWIVAWVDYRTGDACEYLGQTGNCGDVWIQRLDNTGQKQWSANDFTGVEVDADETSVPGVRISQDHQGGVFVVFEKWISGIDSLYAQRVQGDGSLAWNGPVVISSALVGAREFAIADDGSSELVVAWAEERNGARNIFANKLAPSGTIMWGEGGVQVSVGDYNYYPDLCFDGLGGYFVTWDGMYMQRINSSGQFVWGGALQFNDNDLDDYDIALSMNEGQVDGCIVAVAKSHESLRTIRAHKISFVGSRLWGSEGVVICSSGIPDRFFAHSSVQSDGLGGCLVAWEIGSWVAGLPYSMVRGARVTSYGQVLWGTCGVAVSPDSVRHHSPAIVTSDSQHVIAIWERNCNNTGLRYQVLDKLSGTLLFPAEGISLMQGIGGYVSTIETIQLGSGRTAILWEDQRASDGGNINHSTAYFQIVDTLGNNLGSLDGDSLAPADTGMAVSQNLKSSCDDGEGGFFAVLYRPEDDPADLRVVHIDSSGTATGNPAGRAPWNGSMMVYHTGALCASDASGGVFVGWDGRENAQSRPFQYLMRLDGSLNLLWPDPVAVVDSANERVLSDLVSGPDGSCFVAWEDLTGGSVWVANYLSTGQLYWSFPVFQYWSVDEVAVMLGDGVGGVYVGWRNGSNSHCDVLAQRVTANGEVLWNENGLHVADNRTWASHVRMAVDAHRDLTIVWAEYSEGVERIYAERVSPDGELIWGSPREVTNTDLNLYDLSCTSDGSDGIFVVWAIGPAWDAQLYGIHFDAWGNPANDPFWVPTTGSLISPSIDTQYYVSTSSREPGSAIVSWIESTDWWLGHAYDVKAQRITLQQTTGAEEAGKVPGRFALEQNYPNPFNPVTRISFELAKAGEVKLDVFDILGRRVASLVNGKMDAGQHHVAFDASKLASGIYVYRIEAGGFRECRKMVVLK